jgi:ABC-type antimicrobial peptide transport system permease subunit
VQPFQLGATVFSVFGILSLALAAIGLYGVLGSFVSELIAEIGVRRAVGAPARAIVGLVVRQSLVPLGAGLILGMLLALAGTRYLASLLFGIEPWEGMSRRLLKFAAAR